MNPLVSIIIPTYNQKPDFIIDCINSAITQSYTDIEICISDNHSSNEVPEILYKYAKADTRIKIIRPPAHVSVINNFLFAASNATGKYICFISSDDILLPTCIEELVNILEQNPEVAIAHSNAIHFTPDGNETFEWNHFNGQTGIHDLEDGMEKIIGHRYTYMAGVLIRNDLYRQIENPKDSIKYSENITYSWDTYLLFRLLELGKIAYVNHPLAKVRVENEQRENINAFVLQDLYYTYLWLEGSNLMKRIPDASRKINQIKVDLVYRYLPILVYKRLSKILSREQYLSLLAYAYRLVSANFFLRKTLLRIILIIPGLPVSAFRMYRSVKYKT